MQLNHGIALSPDGKTLYVSSADAVFSYPYDAGSTSGNFVSRGSARKLIGGMRNSDHITRTLLVAQRFSKGQLLVSRGSADNIDAEARILSSGHSQLKLFDLSALPSGGGNESAFDFTRDGKILAWGLRNSVGVAEEPTTGGIFTVENSADELRRDGVDIHQNNPGEELNFHGFLNGSETAGVGGNPPNYGYPDCFAMWDTQAVPNAANRTVGSQFPVSQSESLNDAICNRDFVAPRLTFAAHMAPLDIKFTSDGSEAYISFHGSCKYLSFRVFLGPQLASYNTYTDVHMYTHTIYAYTRTHIYT